MLCGFNLERATALNLEVSLMKNMLVMALFILAMLAWAAAQQPGSAPERNSGQTASPSSQAPHATQTQPSKPDGADQAGSRGQASQAPVTEGCLGGSAPNYTITDKTGTVYKLNMPPNADTSKLASHVGESVQVQGDVKDAGKPGNASIDVQAIGRGTGNCPASGPRNTQPPPKQ
jgi:cytoskeletal protein RodZ